MSERLQLLALVAIFAGTCLLAQALHPQPQCFVDRPAACSAWRAQGAQR